MSGSNEKAELGSRSGGHVNCQQKHVTKYLNKLVAGDRTTKLSSSTSCGIDLFPGRLAAYLVSKKI